MKLRDDIIDKVKGNHGLRKLIQAALGVSRTTVWNHLDKNEDNGDLTKLASLKLIAEHYNEQPEELLVEIKVEA